MAITATDPKPDRHVELSDLSGSPVVRLMLSDAQGDQNPFLITRSKYPRSATKIAQGTGGKYSDLELPYENIVQDDWSGGQSSEFFEDNKTMYMDGERIYAEVENQIILGGQEVYSTGSFMEDIRHMPGSNGVDMADNINMIEPGSGGTYSDVSYMITVGANDITVTNNFSYMLVLMRLINDQATSSPFYTMNINWKVEIHTDSAGAPSGTTAAEFTLLEAAFYWETGLHGVSGYEGNVEGFEWTPFICSKTGTLSASTTYHVVLSQTTSGGADDQTNGARYIELPTETADTGVAQYSDDDQSSWNELGQGFFFYVPEGPPTNKLKLFRYRGAEYALQIPDDGTTASTVWLNGDRGCADAPGNSFELVDGTKSWTTNEWAGAIALVVGGTGVLETTPWRRIISNTGTVLTTSPAWEVTHDTTTEYVILGADTWQSYKSIGAWANEVQVAGRFVYFVGGSSVYRYEEGQSAGAWYVNNIITETDFVADKLAAIREPESEEYTLWGVDNQGDRGVEYWRATVPHYEQGASQGGLYHGTGTLLDNKSLWDAADFSGVNVSQQITERGVQFTIGAGHTTGTIAAKNLSTAIDLTGEAGIDFNALSSITVGAGQYRLRLWDRKWEDLDRLASKLLLARPGRKQRATSVGWRRNKSQPPSALKLLDRSGGSGAGTYTDQPGAIDHEGGTYATMTITTDDRLLIGASERFNRIFVEFGGTPNSVSNTLTLQVYNDSGQVEDVPGTVTDGTDSGPSFGQDGTISFDMPATWNPYTIDSASAYWVSLKWDVNLTASVTVQRITVWDDNQGIYIDLPLAYDGDFKERKSAGDSATIEDLNVFSTAEYLYVCGSSFYDKVHFTFVDLNATASTLSAEIWTEGGWQSITITDGTSASSATFGQSGAVTLKPHDNWEAITFNSVSGYWIRFGVSVSTDDFQIADIQVANSREFFYFDLSDALDGDSTGVNMPQFQTGDYLMAAGEQPFEDLYINVGTANGSGGSLSTIEYWASTGWETGTLDDQTDNGNAFGQDGTIGFTSIPEDWEQNEIDDFTGYWARIALMSTSDENFTIIDAKVQVNTAVTTLLLNTLTADLEANMLLDLTPDVVDYPNWRTIQCIELFNSTDQGACTLEIPTEFQTVKSGPLRFALNSDTPVNRIAPYGRERINPWVLTQNQVYEIQTENGNVAVPVPISGFQELGSEITGRAVTHQDVYLWFSLTGNRIERYFDGSLEDVGPQKGTGLRRSRQGEASALAPYPGKVFASFNTRGQGHSTVHVRRSSAWHQVFRGPAIYDIHDVDTQPIPGKDNPDRIWVSIFGRILYVPLPSYTFNPLRDEAFPYTFQGYLTTGWITADLIDVDKLFKSVTLFTENLSSTDRYIQLEYMVDTGGLDRRRDTTSDWTMVTTNYTTSPSQSIDLAATYVTGKRIRFRAGLYTNDPTETPVLKAMLLEALISFPLKFSYTFNFSLSDIEIDWDGTGTWTSVGADDTQLVTWLNSPTPLTFRCPYTPYDNKTVKLESLGSRPIPPLLTEQQFENHIGEITVLEI